MQDQVEGPAGQRGLDGGLVAQIDDQRGDEALDARQVEQAGRLVRRQRQAGDLRADAGQSDGGPCALEPGVAGEQDPLAAPETCV
ncbi:MAG: hypothetical protein ACXWK7_19190 [Caulobacteraceae bacterium]